MTNNNLEGQQYWRLDLYHSCMDIVVAEINELSSVDKHFQFAQFCRWEGEVGAVFLAPAQHGRVGAS